MALEIISPTTEDPRVFTPDAIAKMAEVFDSWRLTVDEGLWGLGEHFVFKKGIAQLSLWQRYIDPYAEIRVPRPGVLTYSKMRGDKRLIECYIVGITSVATYGMKKDAVWFLQTAEEFELSVIIGKDTTLEVSSDLINRGST
jgi:hypothetical protein